MNSNSLPVECLSLTSDPSNTRAIVGGGEGDVHRKGNHISSVALTGGVTLMLAATCSLKKSLPISE